MISEEEKEKVRAATDLVALVQETVELKPRGQEFWGCCPFHGEKTPSFHVIPATQVWHCFGCSTGGDCFTYVMKRENLSFPEAIRYLADKAGIELSEDASFRGRGTKKNRLVEVCEATCDFYHTLLMRGKDGRGRDYFKSRGFGADVCRTYRLGFAPGRGALVAHLRSLGFTDREMIDANVAYARNRASSSYSSSSAGRSALTDRFFDRVMFPIMDEQGKCIAFGGRIMGDGQPKYLNTAETSLFHKKRNLYAFNWAKEFIVAEGTVIVTEGYTDVIAMREAGIKNVVATLGTALTEHHVKTLARFAKRIVYLFDGDEAGQRAAERAIQFIESQSVDLRCVILPENLDPMEFVSTYGAEAMRERLEASEPLMDFVFRRLSERFDVTTPGGRAQALEDACRLLYPLRSSYMIDTYYVQVADRLGIDASMVRESAARLHRDIQRSEAAQRKQEASRQRVADAAGGAGGGTPASGPTSSAVPDEPYGAGAVPSPAEGFLAGKVSRPPAFRAYTELERRSLACERELLTLLTSFPDAFRAFAERITDVAWVDPRHEAIAWAVLATPEGSSPEQAMGAARAVCPEAAELVSAGTLSSTSAHPTETNVAFLLDTLELYAVRRRINEAQGRLRSDRALGAEERRELMSRAARDAARARELAKRVEAVANPFADL